MNNTNKQKQAKRKAELQVLKAIASLDDIKTVKIVNIFEDDHLMCADTKVNGIDIGFYYCDTLGFLDYWDDSSRAKQDLFAALQNSIEVEEMDFE